MSLDACILDSDGRSTVSVAIGVEPHWEIAQAAGGDCTLLSCVEDYYADTEYAEHEIHRLLDELKLVHGRIGDESALETLTSLQELCRTAIEGRVGISVIAD